jgi:hypothetical protein
MSNARQPLAVYPKTGRPSIGQLLPIQSTATMRQQCTRSHAGAQATGRVKPATCFMPRRGTSSPARRYLRRWQWPQAMTPRLCHSGAEWADAKASNNRCSLLKCRAAIGGPLFTQYAVNGSGGRKDKQHFWHSHC